MICKDFSGVRVGALCDGMGGGSLGDIASMTAARQFIEGVGSFFRKFPEKWKSEKARHRVYEELVRMSHDKVNNIGGTAGKSGTTMTAIVITYDRGVASLADLVHIGDSRCYLVNDENIELLTLDHSVTGGMVEVGYIELHEISETSGRNVLTKHIGDERGSKPDISTFMVSSGSKFILCCDGVWEVLHEKNGLWLPDPPAFDQEVAEVIVKESILRGSSDNVSVLLIDTDA